MSNMNISRPTPSINPSKLAPPTQKIQTKSTMPPKAPSLKFGKTQSVPQTSEVQETQKSIVSTPVKSISINSAVLNTSVSLSALSGTMVSEDSGHKLKGVMKGLKGLFTPSQGKLSRDSSGLALLNAQYNPRASSSDRSTSRLFNAFTYKEFSNENIEFLKFSRKAVKMGVDHPNFDRHIKTSIEHFVKVGSEKEINISSQARLKIMSSYNEFLLNPSVENKAELMENYSKGVYEIGTVINDTKLRFNSSKESFKNDVESTGQGKLWKSFKADHKNWWSNRHDWGKTGMTGVKKDFSNFFKSWGSFSKATANVFFMDSFSGRKTVGKKMENVTLGNRTVTGEKVKFRVSSQEQVKAKTNMRQAQDFASGKTAPKYEDYGF